MFKDLWERIYVCATIFIQRLQVFAGIVWAVLIATDLSPYFTDPKYMAAYLVFIGIVTEISRRYKTKDKLEL